MRRQWGKWRVGKCSFVFSFSPRISVSPQTPLPRIFISLLLLWSWEDAFWLACQSGVRLSHFLERQLCWYQIASTQRPIRKRRQILSRLFYFLPIFFAWASYLPKKGHTIYLSAMLLLCRGREGGVGQKNYYDAISWGFTHTNTKAGLLRWLLSSPNNFVLLLCWEEGEGVGEGANKLLDKLNALLLFLPRSLGKKMESVE